MSGFDEEEETHRRMRRAIALRRFQFKKETIPHKSARLDQYEELAYQVHFLCNVSRHCSKQRERGA